MRPPAQSHFRIAQETVACAALGEADGYILARSVGGSPDALSCLAFHVRAGPSMKNGTVRHFLPRLMEWRTCLGLLKQVKKERDRVEQQLSGLNAALAAFAGVYRGAGETGTQTPQDVREVPSKNRSRTESTLGEGQEV